MTHSMWMPLLSRFAAACLCLAACLPAGAQVKVEGQTFEAAARVADAELRLNGVGLRAVAWLKGYAAGLYLPQKATTPAQVLSARGAKKLQLRLLQDVPAAEFAKAIGKGITRNTPALEMPALHERMALLEQAVLALGAVKKGDVVDLDFVPGRGLLLSVNGHLRSDPIAGEDFFSALLRIFIGERPVDAELKAGLLGGPVS